MRKYACSVKTVLDGKWELKTLMAQILLSEFGGSAPKPVADLEIFGGGDDKIYKSN